MASLTLRSVKGTSLTNSEVDANFSNLNTELASKQNTLVSGTSIKTVNGVSVLGSGNIQIDGGVTSFNSRTGAVTLSSGDVTGALGFTPVNKAGDSITGNLAFSGTGLRITGDFSNATRASRLLFQTSTANSNTFLSLIPNGTGGGSGLDVHLSGTDPDNTAFGRFAVTSASVNVRSGVSGTGTQLPMDFYIGSSIMGRLSTAGNWLFGTTADNATDKIQVVGSVSATSFSGSGANLTGLTSGQITTALGFTPYNSTNPSGYITSSALSSYLPLSGGTVTGPVTIDRTSGGTEPYIGLTIKNTGTSAGIKFQSNARTYEIQSGSTGTFLIYDRTAEAYRFTINSSGTLFQGDSANAILHAGNYNSYAPTLTGGGASGTWGINVTGNAATATNQSGGTVNATTGTFSSTVAVNGGSGLRVFADGAASIVSHLYFANVANSRAYNWQLDESSNAALWGYGGSAWAKLLSVTSGGALNTVGAITQNGSQVLHAGNVGTYAHTISTNPSTAGPGTLAIGNQGSYSFVQSHSGQPLNLNPVGNPVNIAGNTAIHAGNYSSYALPLSGGTMSGAITTPAGTAIYVGGQNVSTSSRLIINWHTDGDYNYLIGKRAGGWTQPMDIAFYTGLRYHAHQGYGGHKFYTTGFDGTMSFSVGDGDSNVRVTNTLYVGGNVALHAANYSSYALPLSGGNLSGDLQLLGNYLRFDQTGTRSWNMRATGGNLDLNSGDGAGSFRYNGYTVVHANNPQITTEWYHSDRDYPSGTLITTNINYAVTDGDPFVLEIRGNSYGNIVPLDLQYQGYIYANTIINHGGLSNGLMISGLVALNVGGNLCFWFPTQGYWNGYNVKVYAAYATRATNRVTSISGTAKPSGTKEVALTANIRQSLHSGNYNSYSPTLTGGNASGTWGINITGSANTANSASNSNTVGGLAPAQFFNNMGNNHGTYTDFNSIPGFGNYYVQGSTNSPTGISGNQFYGFTLGLGNEYAYSSYASQIYYPRRAQNSDTYIYVRDREAGSWTSWVKIKAGYADSAGSASSASYLPPAYAGGQQTNPQVYFNADIGLKVAMTGYPNVWSDTVWINGYSGGDVPWMCALHTIRNSEPRMWISAQQRQSGSYGTAYEFLSTYNYTNFTINRGGDSMSGRLTLPAWTTSGRNYSNEWIEFGNYSGLYSPLNGAHFYPNNTEYGSWRIAGSRAGWHGIYFDSGANLMMNSNEVGFHRAGAGWMLRWQAGTGYVHKGDPGGGTSATILDSSNYGSFALPLSGGTVSGFSQFNSGLYAIGNGSVNGSAGIGFNAFSTGGNGAIMAFHRGGYYAVNMGLDSDNVIRIGGWSAAANRWQLDMSGNMTAAGNVTAYSDERLKKDWADLPANFIERLAAIKHGTYTRIDNGERQAGASAQDWQALLPEAVTANNDEDKTLALAYGNAAVVSAIELAKRVIEQDARIARLESLINKLIGD